MKINLILSRDVFLENLALSLLKANLSKQYHKQNNSKKNVPKAIFFRTMTVQYEAYNVCNFIIILRKYTTIGLTLRYDFTSKAEKMKRIKLKEA